MELTQELLFFFTINLQINRFYHQKVSVTSEFGTDLLFIEAF